jgi:hypothetical protein
MRDTPPRGRLRSIVLAGLVAALVGFVVVAAAFAVRDARAGDRFDLVRWQADTFPERWLSLAGRPFRTAPDDDEVIRRYFAHPPGDPVRRELQTDLQRIVEGRLDAVLQEHGLHARLRLPGTVFPPVNIQIAEAPQVLITSPRSVIERRSVNLLRPDLTLERALEIEAATEDADTSAIILPSGGLATYPAVVADRWTYRALLEIAAHEWVHHYLAFYPLGVRYFDSAEARIINETVADLVGDEVAALVLERWGDPTAADPVPVPPAPAATQPTVDRFAVLRDLRIEVDALLADGLVEEAEERMEEVRLELEAAGVVFRRINQAFFAWFGTYAARPDAVDPIGAYLREVRERIGSLHGFVVVVRHWTSRADVEHGLVDLGGALRDESP